jgi:hypothetical protein
MQALNFRVPVFPQRAEPYFQRGGTGIKIYAKGMPERQFLG